MRDIPKSLQNLGDTEYFSPDLKHFRRPDKLNFNGAIEESDKGLKEAIELLESAGYVCERYRGDDYVSDHLMDVEVPGLVHSCVAGLDHYFDAEEEEDYEAQLVIYSERGRKSFRVWCKVEPMKEPLSEKGELPDFFWKKSSYEDGERSRVSRWIKRKIETLRRNCSNVFPILKEGFQSLCESENRLYDSIHNENWWNEVVTVLQTLLPNEKVSKWYKGIVIRYGRLPTNFPNGDIYYDFRIIKDDHDASNVVTVYTRLGQWTGRKETINISGCTPNTLAEKIYRKFEEWLPCILDHYETDYHADVRNRFHGSMTHFYDKYKDVVEEMEAEHKQPADIYAEIKRLVDADED